jgi:hypothetical protein
MAETDDLPPFTVVRDGETLPSQLAQGLSRSADLFAAAKAAGLTLALVVSRCDDATRKKGVKRRHDVKGALRTLEYAVEALRRGESLAPSEAAPGGAAASKLDAVIRAVAVLRRECPGLLDAAYPP